MAKTVLFDMDGTLLPMDCDKFVERYFTELAKKLAPLGFEPKKLTASVWTGTKAMVTNDGRATNKEVFWKAFSEAFGEDLTDKIPLFDAFYENEFNNAREACGLNPEVAETVKALKAAGYTLVLATNPLFPMTAQVSRVRWSGLSPEDFIYITSYENSHYCKPNPAYYKELLDTLGLDPAECLMVGNDATEDVSAKMVGLDVFLITDCLLNKDNVDITDIPHGGYPELAEYIRAR